MFEIVLEEKLELSISENRALEFKLKIYIEELYIYR